MNNNMRIKMLESRLETKDAIQNLRRDVIEIREKLRAIQDYLNIRIDHHVTVAKLVPAKTKHDE